MPNMTDPMNRTPGATIYTFISSRCVFVAILFFRARIYCRYVQPVAAGVSVKSVPFAGIGNPPSIKNNGTFWLSKFVPAGSQ